MKMWRVRLTVGAVAVGGALVLGACGSVQSRVAVRSGVPEQPSVSASPTTLIAGSSTTIGATVTSEVDRLYGFEYSPKVGRPGDVISVSGTCVLRGIPGTGMDVYLRIPSVSGPADVYRKVWVLEVNADGHVSAGLSIPLDAPAGEYKITGICSSDDQVFGAVDGTFTMLESDNPPTTTGAPTTTSIGSTVTTAGSELPRTD